MHIKKWLRAWFAVVFATVCGVTALADSDFSTRSNEPLEWLHTSLEESQTDERELFDLNEKEWQRVADLKKGIRAHLSVDEISPLEILGIHARSESERSHYAREWAKYVYADTQRVLAFQHAYDQAMKEITEGIPLIDLSKLPANSTQAPVSRSDRLLLFVEFECTPCVKVIRDVLRKIRVIAGLDIFVLAPKESREQDLQTWARNAGIPYNLVAARKITINFENGLLKQINPRADAMPVLMVKRESNFISILTDDIPNSVP